MQDAKQSISVPFFGFIRPPTTLFNFKIFNFIILTMYVTILLY